MSKTRLSINLRPSSRLNSISDFGVCPYTAKTNVRKIVNPIRIVQLVQREHRICKCPGSKLSVMTTQDITARLSFLQWQKLYEEEKPFQIFINIPEDAEDQRNTNLVFRNVCLNIHDVRGHSEDFSLDTNGFMYRQHTTNMVSFRDRKLIEESYLPEIETLLRIEVEGAGRIFFFDWRVSHQSTRETQIVLISPLTWILT